MTGSANRTQVHDVKSSWNKKPERGVSEGRPSKRLAPTRDRIAMSIRTGPGGFSTLCRSCSRAAFRQHLQPPCRPYSDIAPPRLRHTQWVWGTSIALFLFLGTSTAAYNGYPSALLSELHAEGRPAPAEIIPEHPNAEKPLSKEENRDFISSQHRQVKQSWENPGVYAWGSNSGRVVAPDSEEASIKVPRRLPYFDGVLLRDIKLDRKFGAAIDEKGNLLQWGVGFAADSRAPEVTLKGKNLTSLAISCDRVIALSSSGTIYSLPVSKEDQQSGPKPSESSWIPFWPSQSAISYRTVNPANTTWPTWSEKPTAIASGLEHLLIITNSGRLYTAASASTEFPSRGQLGIPGLTWMHRPPGPYDQAHEVTTMKGFNIRSIAAGDYHSLALDDAGRVFAFGDNSYGQLGFDYNPEATAIDAPSLLPFTKLYQGTNQIPLVTSVTAGGANSFFTVDATRVPGRDEDTSSAPTRAALGRVTADTWSCGQGIYGALGNGRWTHMQGQPVKIKALSQLFEYDETNARIIPIRLNSLSAGTTHAAAVMDNVTYLGAGKSRQSTENDTNWGADVLWWGGNEFYQLGTGRRNNVSLPVYIAPMDVEVEKTQGRKGEEHRFQITPKMKVKWRGRNVEMEQRVECGRCVSAVYSGV